MARIFEENARKLREVLSEVRLDPEEERLVKWLSECDPWTVDNFVSIVGKVKDAAVSNTMSLEKERAADEVQVQEQLEDNEYLLKKEWMREVGIVEFRRPQIYFYEGCVQSTYSEEYIRVTALEVLKERHSLMILNR